MTVNSKGRAGTWLTAGAVGIAAAGFVGAAVTERGWYGIFFGRLGPLFWGAIFVWTLGAMGVLISQGRWWLLVIAVVLPVPMLMFMMFMAFMVSCANGHCI